MEDIIIFQHGGFVKLINYMGNDKTITNSARVSHNKHLDEFSLERDEKLIRFLITHGHETPLEHVVFTFHVKAPIFVTRQWFRHRIGSFNEISQRYTEVKEDFFVPTNIRINDTVNKQKANVIENQELLETVKNIVDDLNKYAYNAYKKLIDLGIQRELQRIVLPLSTFTEFYYTVNLRSLINFLKLRLAEDAQYEIREYAKQICELIQPIIPTTFRILKETILKDYFIKHEE